MAGKLIFKDDNGKETITLELYKSPRGLRIDGVRPSKVQLDIKEDLDFDDVCRLIEYLEKAVLPQLA